MILTAVAVGWLGVVGEGGTKVLVAIGVLVGKMGVCVIVAVGVVVGCGVAVFGSRVGVAEGCRTAVGICVGGSRVDEPQLTVSPHSKTKIVIFRNLDKSTVVHYLLLQ